MTYFLDKVDEPPRVQGNKPPAPVSTFWQGLGAAYGRLGLETDQNFKAERVTRDVARDSIASAVTILGEDVVQEHLEGLYNERQIARIGRNGLINNPRSQQKILELARADAEKRPEMWEGIPLSDEEITEGANAVLQAEWQDYQDTVQMMGSGQAVAEFMGGVGAVTADVRNIPFLLAGAGTGSMLRVMGRGAMLNVGAELAFMPSQFEMAERLDIPEPDVRAQLAMAAIGGAAFEGVIEGARRGFVYWRGRQAPTPEAETALAQVEDFLESPVLTRPEPRRPAAEEPWIPPDDLDGPPDPWASLDAETRQTREAAVQSAIDELNAAERANPLTKKQRPLIGALKAKGYQIDPDGEFGQELKAIGVQPKDAPGLFSRKNGLRDLDNLDPDEFADFRDAIGVEGRYLSRQGLLDAIVAERSGTPTRISGAEDVYDLRRALDEAEAQLRNPVRDEARAEQPYVLTPEEEAFDATVDAGERLARVEMAVDDFDRTTGMGLTAEERRWMIAELNERGGYIQDAAEVVSVRFERDVDTSYRSDIDGTDAGAEAGGIRPDEADRGGPAGLSADAPEGRAGNAYAGAPARDEPQARIPGTDRVDTGQAQRDRQEIAARQQQSRMGRLDQERVEDDAGGLFATPQRDMFDDVTSPEAEAFQESVASDLADRIEAEGDFQVMGEDGTMRSAKAVLEELDKDRATVAVLQACGLRQ